MKLALSQRRNGKLRLPSLFADDYPAPLFTRGALYAVGSFSLIPAEEGHITPTHVRTICISLKLLVLRVKTLGRSELLVFANSQLSPIWPREDAAIEALLCLLTSSQRRSHHCCRHSLFCHPARERILRRGLFFFCWTWFRVFGKAARTQEGRAQEIGLLALVAQFDRIRRPCMPCDNSNKILKPSFCTVDFAPNKSTPFLSRWTFRQLRPRCTTRWPPILFPW
ncbi:hypothetical protein JB92DRAFT_3018237 [Gautieria morchelliformis]|nr:hypothetical protein JB92DRAFT_3018237 [Gautieria morchelliformis]